MKSVFGHSVGLEAINTIFFVFCAAAAFIYIRYAWENRFAGYKGLQPLLAWITFLIGSMIVRGSIAQGRHITNLGQQASSIWLTGAIIGSCIAAVGVLCIIRTFSPKDWGHWPWVITLLTALGLTLIRIPPLQLM